MVEKETLYSIEEDRNTLEYIKMKFYSTIIKNLCLGTGEMTE